MIEVELFEAVSSFIKNVGFPIAMTIILIFRLENVLIKNTEAINSLENVIRENKKSKS